MLKPPADSFKLLGWMHYRKMANGKRPKRVGVGLLDIG